MLLVVLYWWSYSSAIGSLSVETLVCETNLCTKMWGIKVFIFFFQEPQFQFLCFFLISLVKAKARKFQLLPWFLSVAPVESGTPIFQVEFFIQNGDFYVNELCVIVKIKVIPLHPPPKKKKKRKKETANSCKHYLLRRLLREIQFLGFWGH